MKKISKFDIIRYIALTIVTLIYATIVRYVIINISGDNFTGTVCFIIVILISILFYASIICILEYFIAPYMINIFSKFLKKNKNNQTNTNTLAQPLDKIRNKYQQELFDNLNQHIEIVKGYSRKIFAPYVSNDEINKLCENIELFIKQQKNINLNEIQLNNVYNNGLSKSDLYHYGWNIWYYLHKKKIIQQKQDEISSFLKKTFTKKLKDVSIETIKSHLKDDENKGIIKIDKNIEQYLL